MIFVECKPDQALVAYVTNIKRRDIIHEFQGKGGVCNQLRKRRSCKGVVDNDPFSVQPRYIQNARLEDDLSEQEIKVLHDDANNNYIIVLCPTLEEWILKAAKGANIDVRKYSLPNDAVKLHREININLDKFKALVDDLKTSGRLKAFKKILEQK
jgi:hypothetical protein